MWVGAAYMSVTLLQMEIRILPEGGLGPILTLLWIGSILLIVWCDIALLIDGVRTRRNRITPETGSSNAVNLLIWITALCFSVYTFWGIPPLERVFFRYGFERLDILLTGLASILIAIVFDAALAIDAVKMWRARGLARPN